ncbi:hypothetical protein [Rubripirellula tenax]|uniref:hypothetical protein n=1 Tax=Rubripirellula tenax TaxID=2528015 RepID=UPI0011B64C08|nr:hypothetical protein [Rubripirellula tenax]
MNQQYQRRSSNGRHTKDPPTPVLGSRKMDSRFSGYGFPVRGWNILPEPNALRKESRFGKPANALFSKGLQQIGWARSIAFADGTLAKFGTVG